MNLTQLKNIIKEYVYDVIENNSTNFAKSAIRDIFYQFASRGVPIETWHGYRNFIEGWWGKEAYIQAINELKEDGWISFDEHRVEWKKSFVPISKSNILSEYVTTRGNILFVDDVKKPNWYSLPENITTARTVKEAYSYWLNGEFDILFLDFDLGSKQTGYTFLCDIIEKYNKPPKKVYCISMNGVGVQKIKTVCERYDIPYQYMPLNPKYEKYMSSLKKEAAYGGYEPIERSFSGHIPNNWEREEPNKESEYMKKYRSKLGEILDKKELEISNDEKFMEKDLQNIIKYVKKYGQKIDKNYLFLNFNPVIITQDNNNKLTVDCVINFENNTDIYDLQFINSKRLNSVMKLNNSKNRVFDVDYWTEMYIMVTPPYMNSIDSSKILKSIKNYCEEFKNMKKTNKLSESLKKMIQEEIREYAKNMISKQDLGVKKYERDVEPHLKRRIEAISAMLSYMKPGTQNYKVVQNILDDASKGMKTPTDKQMAMISAMYAHELTEGTSHIEAKQSEPLLMRLLDVEPNLKRRIEVISTMLSHMKPDTRNYKVVQNILDDASKRMKIPTDKQMAMIASIYSSSLKEGTSDNLYYAVGYETEKPNVYIFKTKGYDSSSIEKAKKYKNFNAAKKLADEFNEASKEKRFAYIPGTFAGQYKDPHHYEVFQVDLQGNVTTVKKPNIDESNYNIYHNSFTSAVTTARKDAENKGYTVDEDSWFREINTGLGKPKNGKTHQFHVDLLKNDKPVKKQLNIQVHDMENGRYELNYYIA